MARPKSKLSADEAREYSGSLAKAAAGDYELMDFAMNVLHVPEALGMEPQDWVDSIGGYVRLGVEQRREQVRLLSGEATGEGKRKRYERSEAEVAAVLGISANTVGRDRDVLEALEALKTPTPALPEAPEVVKEKPLTVAQQRPQIREMIDAKRTDAEIAAYLGRGVATIQKERIAYRKEQAPLATKKALTKGEASALLEGRLAGIELAAINLAAWWLQQGKEALTDDLAWTDETITHTRDKVSMILDSVRGVDSDADTALAKWAAEAEGSNG